MSIVRLRENPLALGFYTPSEAAKLVELSSTAKVYGWLRGWPKREIGPVLKRQYKPIKDIEELSFLDLMEVRFVRYFREQKVGWKTLHAAAVEARKELKTDHPFASKRIFATDGKRIYLVEFLRKAAESFGDERAMDLITKQFQIYEAIKASLVKGVEFDPKTYMVDRWYPRPEKFPAIIIDPRIAHGRPATSLRGVPTEALYDAWRAEEEDYSVVADWFELPIREVRQAVNFQRSVFHAENSH
jgi:uncharacterized protein (DUF433 family)